MPFYINMGEEQLYKGEPTVRQQYQECTAYFSKIILSRTPGQFPMNNIWFSIFLGWLFGYVIVKYRGIKGYRRARPFFLGIILGESFIAGIWAIIGLFTGKGYNFLYF